MATSAASSPHGGSVIVGYHHPCPDGVFGALAAHLHFQRRKRPVRYVPMSVLVSEAERIATFAPTLQANDTLYLIDFTGGPDFIAACCARALRVVVLDHHKTGEEDLKSPALVSLSNLEAYFDMDRSGATMAREFFQVEELLAGDGSDAAAAQRARVLQLFALVEDHDLWRHKLADTKLFAAGLQALKLEFDVSKDGSAGAEAAFAALLALDVEATVAKGREVAAEQERVIDAELAHTFRIAIPVGTEGDAATFVCLAVLTQHPDLRSTQGNLLADLSVLAGLPAAGAVCYEEAALGAGHLKVSLRSVGDCDTTVASRRYGGGGHKNASSFNVAKNVFDTWRVKAEGE